MRHASIQRDVDAFDAAPVVQAQPERSLSLSFVNVCGSERESVCVDLYIYVYIQNYSSTRPFYYTHEGQTRGTWREIVRGKGGGERERDSVREGER